MLKKIVAMGAGVGAVLVLTAASCFPPPFPKPPPTTTTTTSVPATTTTRPVTTTTVPGTTTTTSVTTTTVVAPTTTVANGSACGLASAAFCETFNAPAGNGGRSGDLNPVLWGVSRVDDANPGQGILNRVAATAMQGCGTTTPALPPQDVRICNGKMYESQNDNHGVVALTTYPKQPFDFAGRTGTVAFDVSADSEGTHAAWPEIWITDRPVPGVRGPISIPQRTSGRHDFGFALNGGCGSTPTLTSVGGMWASKNYVTSDIAFTVVGCVTKGSLTSLNHFELRISQNHAEVWGTNPGSTTMMQLAVADGLGLTFTRGLVWLSDVHYNARKSIEPCECGTQWDHTFAWDNLGFDGPKTYRDLSFDVPDANQPAGTSAEGRAMANEGYAINTTPTTLNTASVFRNQTPTGAILTMNFYSYDTVVPSFSVNGNPYINTPWPFDPNGFAWRSIDVPVPLSQVHDGVNTVSFTTTGSNTVVSNINLILVAGSQVP